MEKQFHIKSPRLYELAKISLITDQPEWEHIKNCKECGIAFLMYGLVLDYLENESKQISQQIARFCQNRY